MYTSTRRSVVLLAILLCSFLALPAVGQSPSGPLIVTEGGFCVTELDPGFGAKGGECSPGGIWGDYVYFGDSVGNVIDRVDFFDAMFPFASGPPNISFPVGLVFGPGPASTFGDYLYVASYSSSQISRVTPAGVTSFFASLPAPGDVTFDPSGAYGNDLFATTAFTGPISTIDPAGVVTVFSAAVQATYIRFGPGGIWGSGLYSTTIGGIATVDIAGTPTLLSSGFSGPEGFDWAYGPGFDGDMFVPDVITDEIWRVKPDGTRTLWATLSGASSVTWCNDVLYVTSLDGGCFKVESCPPTPVQATSWGSIKTRDVSDN